MNRSDLIAFIRQRGLAVIATVAKTGHPQAALVGVAATDDGEVVFDTTRSSRKFANLLRDGRVALVIGWDDEQTVQLQGRAEEITQPEQEPAVAAYYRQYPDGRERATWPDIVYVRVIPDWGRYSDYRPSSFGIEEIVLAPDL